MIYKVTIHENIGEFIERKFFSNKKDAIKYGKKWEKRSSVGGDGPWDNYNVTYTYEIDTFKTPKTKKHFLSFLNVYAG